MHAHTHARTHAHTHKHYKKEQVVGLILSRSWMHFRSATHHSQRWQAGRASWGRYMLSEMGNKGVKARSGRPDITRGRRRRRWWRQCGERVEGGDREYCSFPRTVPPGSQTPAHHPLPSLPWVGECPCVASLGASLRSRTARAEEENVTGGCISARNFNWKKR